MRRKNRLPSGVVVPRSECPYGRRLGLSWFLILTAVLNAALPVADRFFSSVLRQNTAVFSCTAVVSAVAFLAECVILVLSTDSPSLKIAFAFCILSALCDTLYRLCALFLSDFLYGGAVLTLLASMSLTAGFLVLSICRDISRDAVRFSLTTAFLLIPRTVFIGLTYYAAWEILRGSTAFGGRLLQFSSIGTLFTGVIVWIAAATVFFFLRTDVPNARYPARLLYENFPETPPKHS